MIEACTSCRFFIPGARASDRDGSCHRHAPSEWQAPTREQSVESDAVSIDGEPWGATTIVTISTYIGWPEIRESDWCGEYEGRR